MIGQKGQLAQSFHTFFTENGFDKIRFFSRPQFDLVRLDEWKAELKSFQPDLLINAAAFTHADRAEVEQDLCEQVNHICVQKLAHFCSELKCFFVHYSSDYVFSGDRNTPWIETDDANPINFYGQSKLRGEQAALTTPGAGFVFRISWVYSQHGPNFVRSTLQRALVNERIQIVNDQFGTPTAAADVVAWTMAACEQDLPKPLSLKKLYHLSGGVCLSRNDWAQKFFDCAHSYGLLLRAREIQGVPSSMFPAAAKRPQNSCLNDAKFFKDFLISKSPWSDRVVKSLQPIFQDLMSGKS